MDLLTARLARKRGCKGCVWARPLTNPHGQHTHSMCQVDAPRTSANQKWPSVRIDDWCSRWLPVED